MNKQLKDLLSKAGEARAQKRQKKVSREFFTWIEDAFNVFDYKGCHSNGKPVAMVENELAFMRADSEEMKAEIYAKCRCCDNEVHHFGSAKNLEELGSCLNLDSEGNFPEFCQYFLIKQPITPLSVIFSQEK